MRKVFSFLREARTELTKVVWPTRRRAARLTVIVVAATVLFGAFIGVVDYGLGQGLQEILDSTDAGAENQVQPVNNLPVNDAQPVPQDQSQPQQPAQPGGTP